MGLRTKFLQWVGDNILTGLFNSSIQTKPSFALRDTIMGDFPL